MSCPDCADRPYEDFPRWKDAQVSVTGCERHVREVGSVLAAATAITELPFNAAEVLYDLEHRDWQTALPPELYVIFLKMVTQLATLQGMQRQILDALKASDQ